MPGNDIVLVDSDALIGINNITDANHQSYLAIAKHLAQNNFGTIVPYPIVLEATTALARNSKINRPDLAARILEDYAHTENKLHFEEKVTHLVSQSFKTNTSRKNTPFDHYLCSLAKKNHIQYIFSFDEFYRKQGLILAEELLKK